MKFQDLQGFQSGKFIEVWRIPSNGFAGIPDYRLKELWRIPDNGELKER